VIALGNRSHAQEPSPASGTFPPIALMGDDASCPSPKQVSLALVAVLPSLVIVIGDAHDGAFPVRITDDAAHFVVTAGASLRRFDDADRDCALRARKAAVFISLVLPSASAAAPTPTTPRPATPAPTPTATPTPRRTLHWVPIELAIGGAFAAAPRSEGSAFTGGGALRLYFGSPYVGGVLGAAGLAPVTLRFTGAGAHVTRVPFDLGVRGRLPLGRVTLSLDATLVLAALITRGVDITPSATAQRLEVGVAIAARAEYWATKKLAPFLQFAVEGVPSAYDFTVPSGATVGHSPQVWLTTTAGLTVKL
jgi:hypothetical protein